MPDIILSPAGLAEALGVSTRQIERHTKAGMPCLPVGVMRQLSARRHSGAGRPEPTETDRFGHTNAHGVRHPTHPTKDTMKVHRITLTVIDFDELGADGVREVIENASYPNRCVSPSVTTVETRDIGPWSDDHPLNNRSTAAAEMARLFAIFPATPPATDPA